MLVRILSLPSVVG